MGGSLNYIYVSVGATSLADLGGLPPSPSSVYIFVADVEYFPFLRGSLFNLKEADLVYRRNRDRYCKNKASIGRFPYIPLNGDMRDIFASQ